MPLKDIIIKEINKNGPLKLSRFMDLCLMHPQYGYYRKSHPIGPQGDFITSPEISQLFGEMLSVFFIDLWIQAGRPSLFNFIEFGPGKGTLLSDILRIFKQYPPLISAIHLFLLESNPHLQEEQRAKLAPYSIFCEWHSDLTTLLRALSSHPTFFIGNEFLDVFPIDQYILQNDGWHERRIAYDKKTDSLVFSSFPSETTDIFFPSSFPQGSILEISKAQDYFLHELLQGLESFPYFGLFIDYGYEQGNGDSLQSLSKHTYANPLQNPGNQDLTAHVNFRHLTTVVRNSLPFPPKVFGPVSQGDFLKNLNIETRSNILITEHPHRRAQIKTDLSRLTSDKEMGTLFKVLGITNNASFSPTGF